MTIEKNVMTDDQKTKTKFLKLFGTSTKNNFRIIDQIGVPHPYCITPKHLEYCDTGILDDYSIKKAEEKGASCGTKFRGGGKCNLSYEKHEQALLVECKEDMKKGKPDKNGKVKMNTELNKWLIKIKTKATKKGFVGFSFLDRSKK